jgi:uncharacterized membrane protein
MKDFPVFALLMLALALIVGAVLGYAAGKNESAKPQAVICECGQTNYFKPR